MRCFAPSVEVDSCGYATIALGAALFEILHAADMGQPSRLFAVAGAEQGGSIRVSGQARFI